MPDTPENRREYPLAYNQVPGTNFALARIGAIISLSCGAILDLGICRYAGKGQGEVSLLRRLWDVLRPGDVLLGDRLMSGWVGMHLLKQRGVDTVSRLSAHRRADFRKGTRLGKDDHLVEWQKPTSIRSVDRRDVQRAARLDHGPRGPLPRRAARIPDPVGRRGDDPAGPRAGEQGGTGFALPGPVEQRAGSAVDQGHAADGHAAVQDAGAGPQGDLDPRAGLQPDPHGHGPGGGRRRGAPRSISFKATLQVLEAFRPLIAYRAHCGAGHRAALYEQMLRAIAVHRVADRPDRFEPRMAKKRPRGTTSLTRPRKEIKLQMLNELAKSKCHSPGRPSLIPRSPGSSSFLPRPKGEYVFSIRSRRVGIAHRRIRGPATTSGRWAVPAQRGPNGSATSFAP